MSHASPPRLEIQVPEFLRRKPRVDYPNPADCPICQGLGVVQKDVPFGHPDFSKPFPCPQCMIYPKRVAEKLKRISQLEALGDKTFQNYHLGLESYSSDQNQAFSSIKLVIEGYLQNRQKAWLVMIGPPGTGKTHLAAAIGRLYSEAGLNVILITAADLLDRLRSTYSAETKTTFEQDFQLVNTIDLLILDDLGAESQTNWAQEKIFQIINHRYSRRLDTIITTNVVFEQFDERIASRLQDKELVEVLALNLPDYRVQLPTPMSIIDELFDLSAHEKQTFDHLNYNWRPLKDYRDLVGDLQRYIAKSYGWLVLVASQHGLGRTHLAAASAYEWFVAQNQAVVFCTPAILLDYLRRSFSEPNAPKHRFQERFQQLCDVNVLILDDFKLSPNLTGWALEKLLELLDYRFTKRKPTFLTLVEADYRYLGEFHAALYSRLQDREVVATLHLTLASPQPSTADDLADWQYTSDETNYRLDY
jgi:DNA replication protein DnaC